MKSANMMGSGRVPMQQLLSSLLCAPCERDASHAQCGSGAASLHLNENDEPIFPVSAGLS